MGKYDDDEPARDYPAAHDRPALHEQVGVLGKRLSEVENDLRRMQKFMAEAGRELGIE